MPNIYEVVWTPDPAVSPWFSEYAHVAWSNRQIAASVNPISTGGGEGGEGGGGVVEPPPTITGYDATVSPSTPSGLNVEVSNAGIIVSAPDALPTVFPFVDLEYQIKRETFHCKTFEELPDEADEVIAFVPDPSGRKDWTITATVNLSDGTRHSAAFVLRMLQNFDTGRDQLVEAVNARRR